MCVCSQISTHNNKAWKRSYSLKRWSAPASQAVWVQSKRHVHPVQPDKGYCSYIRYVSSASPNEGHWKDGRNWGQKKKKRCPRKSVRIPQECVMSEPSAFLHTLTYFIAYTLKHCIKLPERKRGWSCESVKGKHGETNRLFSGLFFSSRDVMYRSAHDFPCPLPPLILRASYQIWGSCSVYITPESLPSWTNQFLSYFFLIFIQVLLELSADWASRQTESFSKYGPKSWKETQYVSNTR